MTRWFDTNYDYLVPEIDTRTTFALHPDEVLAQLREALDLGVPARPVVIGPITFLKLSKSTEGAATARIDELLPLYRNLLALLADAGATWVQLDEPALVTDLTAEEIAEVRRVYRTLSEPADRP